MINIHFIKRKDTRSYVTQVVSIMGRPEGAMLFDNQNIEYAIGWMYS